MAVTTIAGTTAAGGDLCAGAPYSGTSLVEAKSYGWSSSQFYLYTQKTTDICPTDNYNRRRCGKSDWSNSRYIEFNHFRKFVLE